MSIPTVAPIVLDIWMIAMARRVGLKVMRAIGRNIVEINVRKYSNNADVSVEIDNASFELGFHSADESADLALVLLNAADNLLYAFDIDAFSYDEIARKVNDIRCVLEKS